MSEDLDSGSCVADIIASARMHNAYLVCIKLAAVKCHQASGKMSVVVVYDKARLLEHHKASAAAATWGYIISAA